MLSLLVLLLCSPVRSPTQLHKCITSCSTDGVRCWYWERVKCGKREPECIERADFDCIPVMSSLGLWDPRPVDWPTPDAAPGPVQPVPFGAYTTEQRTIEFSAPLLP